MVPAGLICELSKYQCFLVAAHDNPDGDAIGSSAAMGWILQALGKDVVLYNETGFSRTWDWLPLPGPVLAGLADLRVAPEAVIALDCGDAARLGGNLQPLLESLPVFNIDHHQGNQNFGTAFNWVDSGMSAVGEMLAYLAKDLGLALQGELAQALYVSIVTDTGSFSYDNTTAGCLLLTGEMVKLGLPISALRSRLLNNWSKERFYLWSELARQTRLLDDGKLAVCLVSRDLLAKNQATYDDLDGFSEYLRRIVSVRVALVIRELPIGSTLKCKASLRSSGLDDVRQIAARFGGGGHRNAAGMALPVDLEAALNELLPYLRQVWA